MTHDSKAGRIAQTLAMAASFALMPAAQATVTDWGTHSNFELGIGVPPPGAFDDIFSFSLPSFNNLSSTAVSVNLLPHVNIVDGTVNLFEGIFGDAIPDVLKLSYGFNGTTGDVSHSVPGLGSGPYYYELSGNAIGSNGGVYAFTSALTPVPEPQTYGMLLAGLGLMGIVARRRSKGS